MGMQLGGKSGGPMADINVTPLVDVVLVLLIIFMVVTQMLASGVEVKLPKSRTATQVQDAGSALSYRNKTTTFKQHRPKGLC